MAIKSKDEAEIAVKTIKRALRNSEEASQVTKKTVEKAQQTMSKGKNPEKAKTIRENYQQGKSKEVEVREETGGIAKAMKTDEVLPRTRVFDAYIISTEKAIEVKTGRVYKSKFVMEQLEKDYQLLMEGKIKEVTWEFYYSAKTGKGGPAETLRQYIKDLSSILQEAGKNPIKISEKTIQTDKF